MFIRVLSIKFPNELAKKSVIALSRSLTKEQFSNGLHIRLHADISANSCMIILLWKNRSNFDVARRNFGEKFIAEVKEMGGIITISEGDAEVDKAKEIDFSGFNEF